MHKHNLYLGVGQSDGSTEHGIAMQLADELQLHCRPIDAIPSGALYLERTDSIWQLTLRTTPPVSFFPDYRTQQWSQKAVQQRYGSSLLRKAVGRTRGTLLDACAGFGKDALVLASFGFSVTACERHPLIFYMLKQAMQEASKKHNLAKQILPLQSNSKQLLNTKRQWQVIYFDPMFPESRKAQVKKPAQFLRHITGTDCSDLEKIFSRARTLCQRLVVKRHIHAPTLTSDRVDIQYKGQSTRYDVYLSKQTPNG